jgi:hypothetical protein
MTQLYRAVATGLVPIREDVFLNETSDLEEFVEANPTLLGDGMSIIARQIDTGIAGRLDMLGLLPSPVGKRGSQIAVIELKNSPADSRVLLQALRYANWVQGSPDSIRLSLTKTGIDVNDVDVNPRIIVVAPAIESELVELSQYVEALEFDFVEIRRFRENEEAFVVVTRKTPSVALAPRITTRQEWSWERYSTEAGWKKSQILFGKRLLDAVQARIQRDDWPLRCRFRRYYIAFQLAGTKNVLGIQPASLSEWYIWFRLPRSPKKGILEELPYDYYDWNPGKRILTLTVSKPDVDLSPLDGCFETAYKWAAGELTA